MPSHCRNYSGARSRAVLRPRARGSALAYILVIVGSTTVAVLALLGYAGQSYRRQISAEYAANAQFAFEGAIAQIRSEVARNLLTPPLTKNITVGGVVASVTVTDHSATVPNAYKVDLSTSRWGRTYTASYVVGAGADSFLNYAYAIRGAQTVSRALVATNSGGIYAGGNLTVNFAGSSAAGNLKVAGTLGGTQSISVSGTTSTGVGALTIPTLSAASYQAAADLVYSSSTSFAGGTVPYDYYLIYVNGNVTLNAGTYGGKAILFCTGSVTVNGTMVYQNASSQMVIICQGNLTHGGSGGTAIGTYYVGGSLTASMAFNNTRGQFIVGSLSLTANTSCAFDPYFKNNPSELTAFKLPGYWP